ncbi:hypothetical protein P154DRAFT_492792 [Amniculicola lignicola CBS 123094]|uniref:Uncharacterized protein n=1 Tax=Amniculicola lignicola CBS 123094 TaxID=1392246 RepID=A0A6A5WI82_9PLEO|nr:hypothetical protein P154DRAFT_492792 [Amniculicola lignicola CBS 123094]
MRGTCVCTPSEHERVNELAQTACRMQANWAFLTPSMLSLLTPADIPSLTQLLCVEAQPCTSSSTSSVRSSSRSPNTVTSVSHPSALRAPPPPTHVTFVPCSQSSPSISKLRKMCLARRCRFKRIWEGWR